MRITLLRVAPWALLIVSGACFFGLWGFIAGCAVLGLTEWLSHMKDIEAIAGANEIALAQRSDAANALGKRLDALEVTVKELATPERVQATRELLGQLRKVVPGLPR